MRLRLWVAAALFGGVLAASPEVTAGPDEAAAEVRARIEASPELAFVAKDFVARPPNPDWKSGMVSWVAFDAQGHLYELQRGDKAPPILMLDRDGSVLRGWGAGDEVIPHAIRIDPKGNVWTVDAGASRVIEYSPRGERLMTIEVGEAPYRANGFSGTSDIAFANNGHLFITDGYGNARVLEYSADGKRLRQWGEAGTGPGRFRLPHAIQIGPDGVIYVADRENGRIQRFDMDGKFLGEIGPLGRTYSIKLAGGALWAATAPLNLPTGSPGWLLKLDPQTGKILGHIATPGEHGIEVSPAGEPVTTVGDHVVWFRVRRAETR